ncbi:hypothetical protein DL89DRAFT_266232 [Linderina pennispora]|uniref:Glutathione S-transferase n=1 Tax=Linderina pennispora TaxID=61395 RepID=A0A1Y1WCF0_9FUNG|nr:uncharacterized protein DL89DRAFT_266232 [Linderina pennispora]ORX71213.1 hypothetical protein DL89DRAFT_266232 [Linderina pennispora]
MAATDSNTYILRYFDIVGIAETARLMLILSGANWIEENPEWPAAKDQQPMRRLPVLIEKNPAGEVVLELTESHVIERYLARKFGFISAEPAAAARHEQLRDQMVDIQFSPVYAIESEGAAREYFLNKYSSLSECLIKFHTKVLQANGSNGHYFGDKTSYVDLALYAFVSFLRTLAEDKGMQFAEVFDPENVPEFAKVVDTVRAEPALQDHFAGKRRRASRL